MYNIHTRCLFLNRRELLGKVLDSVVKEATWLDGGVKKVNLVAIPHISKVDPELLFLDHHKGHRLAENFVARRAKSATECSSCITPDSELALCKSFKWLAGWSWHAGRRHLPSSIVSLHH